jgi:hypothetical protein
MCIMEWSEVTFLTSTGYPLTHRTAAWAGPGGFLFLYMMVVELYVT